MAWGEGKNPAAGRRRLKVKTGDQTDPLGTPGINGGNPIGPGSVIELAVEGEDVYILEGGKGASGHNLRHLLHSPTGSGLFSTEILFSDDLAVWPTWKDTWVPKLIATQTRKYRAKLGLSDEQVVTRDGKDVIVKKPKGPVRGVELQGKVGGRRRVVKQRPVAASSDKDK